LRMKGVAGIYPRSMYRYCGYTDEELRRPIMGIVTPLLEARQRIGQINALTRRSQFPEVNGVDRRPCRSDICPSNRSLEAV
jgi:hypothetical protein